MTTHQHAPATTTAKPHKLRRVKALFEQSRPPMISTRRRRQLNNAPAYFIMIFLIVGGLYSVTALRKNNDEGVKVYTKHQDLTQASEHHKQMTMS